MQTSFGFPLKRVERSYKSKEQTYYTEVFDQSKAWHESTNQFHQYQYPIAQEEHLGQFQVVVRIPFHYLEQQLRCVLLSMHLLFSQ